MLLAAAVLLMAAFAFLLAPGNDRSAQTGSPDRLRTAHPVNTARSVAGEWERSRNKGAKTGGQEKSSLSARIRGGDEFAKLTPAQLETYVNSGNRSVGTLLAAYRLSKDEAYLKESLERFPHEPQVLLEAARLSTDPAKRLEMLETMKSEDPGNALVDVMSAKALLDMGKNNEALACLLQSAGKNFNDFTLSSWQTGEEAYLSAGLSPAEAKVSSMYSLSAPELIQSRDVGKKLLEMRKSFEAAGDLESAERVATAQLELARQLGDGPSVVSQLVGLVHEKMGLEGNDSAEANEAREEINIRRKDLTEASQQVSALLESSNVPENDWVNYFDRAKLFGEPAANRWLLEKHQNP